MLRSNVFSTMCQLDVWQSLDVNELAELYFKEETIILDRQLPTRSAVKRQPRPNDPWFNAECRATKRSTRPFERAAAAKTRDKEASVSATEAWRAQRRLYCNLRRQKCEEFSERGPNTLHGCGKVNAGDDNSSDPFHQFFVDKVATGTVRTATRLAHCPSPAYSWASIVAVIWNFQLVTVD